MKNKITYYSLLCCFLLVSGLTSCNNQPKPQTETVAADTTAAENPMTAGDGYADPQDRDPENPSILNNGFVFIESTGSGIGGANYSIMTDGKVVSEGVTSEKGDFAADLESGKTYSVSVSAKGYKTQTAKLVYKTGDVIKVGLK